MLTLLKYWRLAVLFKDVVTAYKEETGKNAPPILHRRVYGGIIMIIGMLLGIYFGVDFSEYYIPIIDSIEKLISAIVTLYGTIGVVIGIVKARRKVNDAGDAKDV